MDNLLINARKNKYAVGGFNFNFYEDATGIVMAAQELNLPVYLMASEGCVKFLGVNYIVNFVRELKEQYSIPIILHLDHGRNLDIVKKCINEGFDSIMYDGSYLDFEANIKNTSLVSALCRERGLPLEGELGRLKGKEENIESSESFFTDPDAVPEFVERSSVDSLAVSIGNAHGLYKGKPELDFERLKKINELCPVPLVLHGGTGIPQEDIKQAINLGMSKINVGTELKIAFTKSIRSYLENINDFDIRHLISNIEGDIKKVVTNYLLLFSGISETALAAGDEL